VVFLLTGCDDHSSLAPPLISLSAQRREGRKIPANFHPWGAGPQPFDTFLS
jgi:hypothetical protein